VRRLRIGRHRPITAEVKELRRTTSRLRLITAEAEHRRITVAVVVADPTAVAVRPADMAPREATPDTGKNNPKKDERRPEPGRRLCCYAAIWGGTGLALVALYGCNEIL
jgi:hypothetical protein